MIHAELRFFAEGGLSFCDVAGHGMSGNPGTDIVCAAVTVLVRTTAALLSGRDDISLTIKTAGRGSLGFRVEKSAELREASLRSFLVYAGEFLREGLCSLETEFPNSVRVRTETEKE
ncbi:MAG: ribosomal-processing cysteine protease Prp [Spirochaetaceae bacterium]|jgi:uncharacterized protein YsxB (DUF464 family)|nr:ribosomal-processing cysteine protease Prp [Spirochaetaceae bacterium]